MSRYTAILSVLSVLTASLAAPTSGTSYTISPSSYPELCLAPEVNGNGASLIVTSCGDSDVEWVWNGDSLQNTANNVCADITDGADYSGNHVQVWGCYPGNTNQKYSIDGENIKWSGKHKCLDLTDGAGVSGTRIQIWSCYSENDNQKWVFNQVSSAATAAPTTTSTTLIAAASPTAASTDSPLVPAMPSSSTTESSTTTSTSASVPTTTGMFSSKAFGKCMLIEVNQLPLVAMTATTATMAVMMDMTTMTPATRPVRALVHHDEPELTLLPATTMAPSSSTSSSSWSASTATASASSPIGGALWAGNNSDSNSWSSTTSAYGSASSATSTWGNSATSASQSSSTASGHSSKKGHSKTSSPAASSSTTTTWGASSTWSASTASSATYSSAPVSTGNPVSNSGILQTSGTSVVDSNGNKVVLRGTNIGGWLVMEDWMCGISDSSGNADRFSLTTLENRFGVDGTHSLLMAWQDSWLTSSDWDNMASLGFNVVRLPFGFRNLMWANGSWIPDRYAKMDWAIAQAKSRGIYVIPVFHIWDGQEAQYSTISEDSSTGQQQRDAAGAIWKEVASHYLGETNIAAYDAINEPTGSANNNLQQDLYKAIRSVDSNRIIILESIGENPADYGWTNVMYSMHEYLMMQGDVNSNKGAWQSGVVDSINSWNGFNIPTYLGEFMADGDTLTYMLDQANQLGVWWSAWAYKTVNMGRWGLYNTGGFSVDVNTWSYGDILNQWSNMGGLTRQAVADQYQSATGSSKKRSVTVGGDKPGETRRFTGGHRGRSRRALVHGGSRF